ncbi:sugar isomerase domain-containing protein [soil metagenome]
MMRPSPTESAGRRYLRVAEDLVARLSADEWPRIDAAAALVAEALATGGTLHAFGSEHSHTLAEELFYRAGGLVRVRPILFEGLMLHASAPLSTSLERLPGLAAALRQDHPMASGDVLLIASNSGGNEVARELARLARAGGVRTIGITSLDHATSHAARDQGEPRLHELVDVAIDNGGRVGDAAVEVEGLASRVAPTSTVVGAAIANALAAEVVERLVLQGIVPEVFSSSNVAGGDALNARYLRAGDGQRDAS